MTRAVRQRYHCPLGWLVAIAILLHGWLPILLQVSLLTAEAGAQAHGHAHHAGAPAPTTPHPGPTGKAPECRVLHSAVCLCAVLVKVLPPPVVAVPVAAAMATPARGRFAADKPSRRRRAAPLGARAPPVSD